MNDLGKSAFGHDDATGKLNPDPIKKGRIAQMTDTPPKVIGLIIAIAAGLLLFVVNRDNLAKWSEEKRAKSSSTGNPEPTEVKLAINKHAWVGRTNCDRSKKLRIEIVTHGVRWMLRPDGDDSKIAHMPADDGVTDLIVALPDGKLLEARIEADETADQALAVARLLPNQ